MYSVSRGCESAAGSADGADKLLSYANQIAAEQTQQLMQMRALCNQMLEEAAARDAALANRQAMMDAATQQALAITGWRVQPRNPFP